MSRRAGGGPNEQMPPSRITLDLRELGTPTLATLDALARLQLVLRRHGLELRLRRPPPDLLALIGLAGLRDALGVEAGREPEEREQRLGVEEERDLADPPA